MRSIILRLVTAILTCAIGLALCWLTPARHLKSLNTDGLPSETLISDSAKQTAETAACDLDSEISLERIHDGCENCPDRKIVIRRDSAKKFEDAAVIETDLHSKKERRGTLRAYYFNNLLRLIEGEDYFSMSNQYAMEWVDSVIVTISVSIGEKNKVVRTRSEGHVPIPLWGIYYAVEGASAHVRWESRP